MKIKNLINKLISLSGYQLTKKSSDKRNSSESVLKNIASHWSPDSVIDVGAAMGLWTKKCHKFFPASKYALIEPLEEFALTLKELKEKSENISIVRAAAAAVPGKTTFNVHADLFGSSLKKEAEGTSVDGQPREIETKTLDQIASENNLTGKFLIKLDVQGAELEALQGAKNILQNTECLILEVSLLESFVNGVDLTVVVGQMKEWGFVVYDIFGELYRPYDNALHQVDLVFVRENGLFRKFHGYATEKQRAEQNEKFKKQITTK